MFHEHLHSDFLYRRRHASRVPWHADVVNKDDISEAEKTEKVQKWRLSNLVL
jgi:hypothetical protein